MAQLTNFYEKMDKKLLPKSHNPGIKCHGIVIPARILVVGASGSMKTNAVLNLIHEMKNTFEEIIVFCRDRDEPLYNHLSEKIKDAVTFYEVDPDDKKQVLPTAKDIGSKDKKQRLIIFDDLCLLSKAKQRPICEFFIMGRKFNMTSIYITQSYYETPKTIRSQCNYIILKKISGANDLAMILREYQLAQKLDDMIQVYKFCVKDQISFMMIDLHTNDDGSVFRKNFKPLILQKISL